MKTKISVFIAIIAFLLLATTTIIAQNPKMYYKKNGVTAFQRPISDIDSIVFRQNPYSEEGIQLINKVSAQCGDYIESYLQQYFSQSGNADINDLVKKINNIDEVEEASPNDDNSLIRIKLKSGAYFNHLLFRMDDDRLFTAKQENIIKQSLNITNSSNNVTLRAAASDYNTPTVKKALILAPFYSTFNDDLSGLSMNLKNAGYDVTPPIIDVTVDNFRGDFLKQYGVIYISTHGGYDAYPSLSESNENNPITFLLTSIKFNFYIFSSYSEEDQKNLALISINNNNTGQLYLAVSENLIYKNLNPLPNSLVYIDACYSARNPQFISKFFNAGAGAYIGWVKPVKIDIKGPMAVAVFGDFSKGLEFGEEFNTVFSEFDNIYGYYHDKANSDIPYYLKINDYLTSTPEINFTKDGGTQSFIVETNLTITNVTSNQSWCKVVSYNASGTNEYTVNIKADKNTTTSPRPPAIITVDAINPTTNATNNATVTVTQDAGEEENPDWVLINSVKWATRNVGAPGTFVQNPEDYGEIYQWNKGTITNFLLYNDYSNSVYANADSWLPANDPSPNGFRVPTWAELNSLRNTAKVTNERTTQKGVIGYKFTDIASGNSIFMPIAGYRDNYNGALVGAGTVGGYWSSTKIIDTQYVYFLAIDSEINLIGILYRCYSFSLRPVLK